MNYFCSAKRGKMYQYANKDMRKGNSQALSIESMVDENGRQLDCFGSTPFQEMDGVHELVKHFLDHNKPLEALIIDGVAYQDSFKTNKEKTYKCELDSQGKMVNKRYITSSESFDMRRLVRHLSTVDSEFIKDYFCKTYLLNENVGDKILKITSTMSNPKWYKYIKKTIVEIKDNKKLLSCLLDID